MENINEIIYSRDNFTSFKQNPTEDSLYNLVSKLYIKLPFLKLNPKIGNIIAKRTDKNGTWNKRA